MKRPLIVVAAAAVAFAIVLPVAAMAQGAERTKVGTLTCDVSGGIGFIIGSKKHVSCMFTPLQPGPREVYSGSITKFGLDIGATTGGEMVWSVVAPTTRGYGALAGDYTGVTGEATVGAGAGANILVGGSNRTVSLQPISGTAQAGLNLAVGVAGLELRPAR